jgi:hypothetical protein
MKLIKVFNAALAAAVLSLGGFAANAEKAGAK